MASICFYFQVHQPFRLRHYTIFDTEDKYFDDYRNDSQSSVLHLQSLSKWHRVEEFLKEAYLLVCARPGFAPEIATNPLLRGSSSIIHTETPDISSTALRSLIGDKKYDDYFILPEIEPVAEKQGPQPSMGLYGSYRALWRRASHVSVSTRVAGQYG